MGLDEIWHTDRPFPEIVDIGHLQVILGVCYEYVCSIGILFGFHAGEAAVRT